MDEGKYNLGLSAMEPAQAIRDLRETLGLSQSDFARLLRCSQSSLSRYESGEVNPGIPVLVRMIEVSQSKPHLRDIFQALVDQTLPTYRSETRGKESANAEQDLKEILIESITPRLREAWDPLIDDLVSLLSADREVDPSIAGLIEIWRWRGKSAQSALRDALGYVKVKLGPETNREEK